MPNRILREGYLDSRKVEALAERAEVLFVRLLLVVDDFGRFDGRVSIIRNRCWPTCTDLTRPVQDVQASLMELARQQLVVLYEAGGEPYLYIPNFRQRTRSPRSKYPPPPENGAAPAHQPVDNPPKAPRSPVEENPNQFNGRSDDGQMTVVRQPDDGQMTAIRARSSPFVLRNSNGDDGHPSDIRRTNPTSTPRAAAHSLAKAEQAIQEARAAAEHAAPPPTGSALEFFKKATAKAHGEPQPFEDDPT